MTPIKLFVLFLTLLAIACSGSSSRPASAPPGGGQAATSTPAHQRLSSNGETVAGAKRAPSDASSAEAEGQAFDEPAPAAPSARGRAVRPLEDKRKRPGLGTRWGETRSSRVSTTPFVREDSDTPFEVVRVFYDDAAGIRAMARRNGLGSLRHDSFEIAGGALSVRLLDASARVLPALSTGNRQFVVGEDGERYVIQIRNHTDERFEVVATVDGLDVVDGRHGSFAKRGYVIQPLSTLEIDGFRQSFDTVAAFRFGAVDESYASGKGDGRNVGVIGIAFFAETGTDRPWHNHHRAGEARRRLDAEPFPVRFAEPPRGL